MKSAKPLGFFAFGILAAILAGCFNPITVIPPKTTGNPLVEPFTVDILIGNDTQARSVVGPTMQLITTGNILNTAQLIVVDSAGNIVAFAETRRQSDADIEGELRLESLGFGQTYHFLLLMGYWDRDYERTGQNGAYEYKDVPPTLLAAGLKSQEVTGSGKVTITMWPMVVDTVFTTTNADIPSDKQTTAPVLNDGKPGTVSLFPVDWKITWTVQRSGAGGDGFAELIKAQKILKADAGNELKLNSKKTLVRGTGFTGDTEVNAELSGTGKNAITLDIGTYTSGITRIGKGGSANFKLEYVPFNFPEDRGAQWTSYKDKSEFDLDGKAPVWIIRNGVNDAPQDNQTNFQNSWSGTANGNGAVCFAVAPPQSSEELVINNGIFQGPQEVSNPNIGFTTGGYNGEAEVYYAVVPSGTSIAPGYSAYTKMNQSLGTGTHTGKQISLPSPYPPSKHYDIYVLLLKGGKVSNPIKISTTAYIEPWNKGRFVAVSYYNNDAAFTSNGGETWQQITMPSWGTGWSKVIFGKGLFVAIGTNGAAWSDNGGNTWKDWTLDDPLSEGERPIWTEIAYGNNMFVALAYQDPKPTNWNDDWGDFYSSYIPRAAYSTDGKTWSLVPTSLAINGYWREMVYGKDKYGKDKFVAVADKGDREYRTGPYAAYSKDGRSWTNVTDLNMAPIVPKVEGEEFDWNDVAYGKGMFVAVSEMSVNWKNSSLKKNFSYTAYSEDGVTWTTPTQMSSGNWILAFGNNRFVGLAWKDQSSCPIAAYSTDGKTWADTGTMTNLLPARWAEIAFGNNMFMAVGYGSNRAAYSADGQSWDMTTGTLPGTQHNWGSVAFGAPQ